MKTLSTARQSLWFQASPVAESVRKSQDSLPHRQAAEDLVGKVPCQVRHAPFAARRTEVTALAREGDEDLVPAVVAAEAGEAARQDGAGNELAELPLDELGEPIAGRSRLLEEGFEAFAKDAVQDSFVAPPGLVGAGCAGGYARKPDPGTASLDSTRRSHERAYHVEEWRAFDQGCSCGGMLGMPGSGLGRSRIRTPNG
jgi:hypothetical protein